MKKESIFVTEKPGYVSNPPNFIGLRVPVQEKKCCAVVSTTDTTATGTAKPCAKSYTPVGNPKNGHWSNAFVQLVTEAHQIDDNITNLLDDPRAAVTR